MKKIGLIIGIIIVFAAIWIFSKKYIGDIRPLIFPAKDSLKSIIREQNSEPVDAQTGEAVEFPINLPEGFEIGVFSENTPGARDLVFSSGGTLLVSETGQGKVIALPDINRDGVADEEVEVVNNLNKPHGLLFDTGSRANQLYIVEETRLARYIWDDNTKSAVFNKEILKLPAGGRHFTRTLAMDKAGNIYISLGSTCDTCFEKHDYLSAVIVTDREGQNTRVYSKGLRNAVFITTHPQTDKIWVTEMGRDFLGDDVPHDEINILQDGRDYGWPVCYDDKIYDTTFNQRDASYCANTIPPVFKIQAHSAPLGLTFIDSPQMPKDWQGDLLVAYHGSWNRSVPVGYKIVKLDIEGSQVTGESDFMTGFLQGSQALGRPVDVVFDDEGSLYVSDDKSGAVYKIIKSQ